jgi:uncharacterized protein (DUF302 family)
MNLTAHSEVIKNIQYGYRRTLAVPFEKVLQSTKEALLKEGFGVLCEINLREKFQEKLGVDFHNYVILGVCNPLLAFETLQHEINIGLFLPCNVIVYEEQGHTAVAVIDAEKMLTLAGNPKLELTASVVNERLRRVLESV